MLLKLDDIAVLQRARKDMGDVEGLAASIKTNGQITPIAVRPARPDDLFDDGAKVDTKWVLVAGGRRFAAHILNGAETIKAENLEEMTPLQHSIVELEENLARKQLEWAEELYLKERIHNLRIEQAAADNKQWSQKETAREIGEDPGNLSKDLKLLKQIRENPELLTAPTKKAAIRMMDFKESIRERVANISKANLVELGQKIVTADMREYSRSLATASVDLVFTDLPFGIEYNFEKHDISKYSDREDWLHDLMADIVPQAIRVTKESGWIVFMMGSTNYESLRILCEGCCAYHYEYRDQHTKTPDCYYLLCEDPEWIWFRPNSRNPSMWPDRHAQNQYEKFCVVNRGKARLTITNRGNVLVHDAVYSDRIHEMQRPHSLCVDVVERFTLTGELVVDFCFGSGSALAAAADLGRDFRGCDINPNNREPAMTLVSQYLKEK